MFETISYACSLYHIDCMPKDSENYPFFHMDKCWPKEKNRRTIGENGEISVTLKTLENHANFSVFPDFSPNFFSVFIL